MSDDLQQSGALLLVADDERDILTLLRLRLERRGYRVVTADNGRRALELALAKRPALAILDVRMPELDGYELTEQLRQHDATTSMPIILLSASVHQVDAERGMEVGASAYLRKPFSPHELIEQVERLLADSRQT